MPMDPNERSEYLASFASLARNPWTMTTHREDPPSSPALVLQRWNSWVRVYLPDTREVRWVDLTEVGYEPMPEGEPPLAEPSSLRARS
jgi:hypothetical protein